MNQNHEELQGDGRRLSIVVNGEDRLVPSQSVSELLNGLGLEPGTVVVELNRVILRREALSDTDLSDGDRLELVHFVGGG